MNYRVRPVTLLEQSPDLADLGVTVGIHSSATFPAHTLVQVTSGVANNMPSGAGTNLALATEPALDPFYQAEGPGNSSVKPGVPVLFLKGQRIGMTVVGTWNNSFLGNKYRIRLDTPSGYAVIDPTLGTGTLCATVLRVFGDQQIVISGTSTNVYVEAILDDTACLA